jgi:hypothetical protein
MSVTGFNRRREAQKKAAEEAARLKEQSQVDLDEMTYQELRALAKERKIEGYYNMNTDELREALKEGG